VGGIQRQVEALARQQRELGHDVTVLTSVPGGPHPDLEVIYSGAARWRTFASPVRIKRLSRRALGVSRPYDLIHAHLSVASPLAVHVARVASRRGIPTALTVHSIWPRSTALVRGANLPYWWGPIRGAWSAVGTVAAEQVAAVLPALREVLVVPNIVDIDWWRATPATSADLVAAPPDTPAGRAPQPRPVELVTVGRLTGLKRVDALLDVVAAAKHRLEPALVPRLTIVGDGPRREDLHAQASRLGLDEQVRWLGHQSPEQIRSLLHSTDLFVAPARRESFGIAALEARAAGLPILGLRGNGLSDFIEDGAEGVLVEDDARMADALVQLCTDVALLPRLRAVTSTQPPSLSVADSIAAVDELYARASWQAGLGTRTPVMDDAPAHRPRRGTATAPTTEPTTHPTSERSSR
jgi:glycosyltransferase involved in cell wall biosynthesis